MMKYILLFVFLGICVLLVTDLFLTFNGKRTISISSLKLETVAAGLFAISMILQIGFAKNPKSINAFEVIFVMYTIADWILYARQKRRSQNQGGNKEKVI